MTEQPALYKVVLRYEAIAATDVAMCLRHTVAAVLEFTTDLNRESICGLLKRTTDWLAERKVSHYYVNWYDQSDHMNGFGQIVIVLNDRTTALMIKLALT